MKNIKNFRIILAILFFLAALTFLFISRGVHPMSVLAERVQVIPSAIAVCMGVTAFWFVATLLFGRVYCSTVCPVGTLSDICMTLRRRVLRRGKPFRYRARFQARNELFIGYLICLLLGLGAVPFIMEPWNIMRNVASTVNPSATAATWQTLSIGMGAGVAAGVITIAVIVVWSFFRGRDFCNSICPLGTAMGLLDNHTLFHIEIDPDKCVSCMKCEEGCRSSCIKVSSRQVDNSRCVRCFSCLDSCPSDAIRFQISRNRPATPLFSLTQRSVN